MRLRILTKAPLPELKFWFNVDTLDTVRDISDLKRDLCGCVEALRDAGLRGSDVFLYLDDFELLNESSLCVLREGDLIHVKVRMAGSKRKVINQDVGCSSSSASSGSRFSGTDSESDTQLSSDTDSLRIQPSSTQVRRLNHESKRPPIPLVPPGHGKPSTHSRNLRRRLKRQHEQGKVKLDQKPAPPSGTSAVNVQPLGWNREGTAAAIHAIDDHGHNEESGQGIMMASLRNKNKRKGFRNSMGPIPKKIVFRDITHDDDTPMSTTAGVLPLSTTDDSEFVSSLFDRLIHPSEKQDKGMLPPGMFVTSVDVEAQRWEGGSLKRMGKRKNSKKGSGFQTGECTEVNDGYGDMNGVHEGRDEIDFELIESGWERFKRIGDVTELDDGMLVGWKAMAINPRTLSPEVLVNVVRIIRCESDKIGVQPLIRPASFCGTGDEEGIEEQYMWDAVIEMGWRVVDTIHH